MATVTDIMLNLANPDPSVQKPAEQMVAAAKEADLAGFLIACLGELRDEAKPSVARQMAGIVLKNSVALHLKDNAAREELEAKWIALPAVVRSQVKSEVLATLGSPTREVRNIAAIIIGNLARIELPAKEWPDLIGILVSACTTGAVNHMEAALTALGYVCEESKADEAMETELATHSTTILQAICQGMTSTNEDVKYFATNALCNSMEFISENMENEELRNFLVRSLCDACTKSTAVNTRERAMECLVAVADLYYNTLPAYIAELHAITTAAVFNDQENVALQAMLFWIAICDTEKELQGEGKPLHNYARMGAKQLTELCTQVLVRQEEGQTEDDWNLSLAGSKLLQSLAECIGDEIMQHTMPFVYKNINSTNWREREAALMAFGCILGGPDPKAIQDTVAQAVDGLLSYVRDQHELVSDTAGWALSVVCELFVDVFLDPNNPLMLSKLLNVIGPMIAGKDAAKSIRASHALHNLALAYEDEEDQSSNELSPYFNDIVVALLGAIDYQGSEVKVRYSAQEALNVIIDAAASDCYPILLRLVPELVNRLDNVLRLLMQSNDMDLLALQALLCASLNATAKKLKTRMTDHVDAIVSRLLSIFQRTSSQQTVQEEALALVGALAHAVGPRLIHHLPSLLPSIMIGIKNTDEDDLCHVAIGVIGDLCSSLQEKFIPYSHDVLVAIKTCLESQDVDRELKTSFIGCLGDLALNLGGEHFSSYLSTFMMIIGQMYGESKTINFKNDADSEDYVMMLWQSIAEFFTAVCQGFNGACEALVPYMQDMLTFAVEVAHQAHHQEDVFSSAVGLIGDLANVLLDAPPHIRQAGKNALLTDTVNRIMIEGSRNQDEAVKDQTKWSNAQLQKLMQA